MGFSYNERYIVTYAGQTTVQTRFDASVLHDNPQVAMETGMVDDGSGSRKVSIIS